MRTMLLILLGLLAVACVGPEPLTEGGECYPVASAERAPAPKRTEPIVVYIDPNVTWPEPVRLAVEAWGRAFAGVRTWAVTDRPEGAHVHVLESSTICHDNAAACVEQIGGLLEAEPGALLKVALVPGSYEYPARVTTMHELGHLLGLTHADGTVMQAAWTEPLLDRDWTCPDAETIARVEWAHGLDLVECGK